MKTLGWTRYDPMMFTTQFYLSSMCAIIVNTASHVKTLGNSVYIEYNYALFHVYINYVHVHVHVQLYD